MKDKRWTGEVAWKELASGKKALIKAWWLLTGQWLNHWGPLLCHCLMGCFPIEWRYAITQIRGFWCLFLSTGLFVHDSGRQTHLLLRMFYEMNRGLRDTYFLPLIKSSLLWAYWIRHGNQQCLLMPCTHSGVCRSMAKLSLFSAIRYFSKCKVSAVTSVQSALLIDCDSISLPSFNVI